MLFLREADRIERECPNRRYVFERHPRKKLKLPLTDIKEVSAANRTDCEDRYCRMKSSNELLFIIAINYFRDDIVITTLFTDA